MIKNPVFLGIISMILVTVLNNFSVFAQNEEENESGSQSAIAPVTKMNTTEIFINVTDVINSLNFSCDINLKCFDKKNQVELVVLTNSTSTVKIPKTFCGDRELVTNGLLLIPHVNSSFSKKLDPFVFSDRGCGIRGDIISGIYEVDSPISIEQFFGEKYYILPKGDILTIKGSP